MAGSTKWNLFDWFREDQQVGDAGSVQLRIRQESLLLDLPPEVRGLIFQSLEISDHRNLRLVCRLLNHDIENDVGVHAKISGLEESKKSWLSFTFVQYLANLRIKEAKLKEMRNAIEWLKSVHVTSLNLQHLTQLPILTCPSENFLRNPFSLKALTVKCSDREKDRSQILGVLAQCSGLKSLRFTYSSPELLLYWDFGAPASSPVSRNEVLQYNTCMTDFFTKALRSLPANSVNSLTIQMDRPRTYRDFQLANAPAAYYFWLPMESCHIGMPPAQQDPQQLDVPSRLKNLDIHATLFRDVRTPYQLGTQLFVWKILLDAQTSLTCLRFRVGMVYWRFYEIILQKCYRSLKELDIEVGNWSDSGATPATLDHFLIESNLETIHIPLVDWFDWTVLFTPDCNLESLIIRMSVRSHFTANRTLNFCSTFAKLKKLELEYVKISQLNLQEILLSLPELRDVSLREWNPVLKQPGNFLVYKQEFKQTFEIIRNSLRRQQLQIIKLFSGLVSGNIYSDVLGFQERAILDPNYTVVWSQFTLTHRCGHTWIYADPTLAIHKNP